jgi:hypothetical protein
MIKDIAVESPATFRLSHSGNQSIVIGARKPIIELERAAGRL